MKRLLLILLICGLAAADDSTRSAAALAQAFFAASDAIDDYRLRHHIELRRAERERLKTYAQELDICGQWYTADALAGKFGARPRCMQLLRKAGKP